MPKQRLFSLKKQELITLLELSGQSERLFHLSRIARDSLLNNDDAAIYNNDENLSYSVFDDLHYFKKP